VRRAGQQVEQRRLARAVRPDDADAVAAQDSRGKAAHQLARTQLLRHTLRRDHQAAAALLRGALQPRRTRRPNALPPPLAQRGELADAPHVALAPRRDAVPQPMLLARDLPRQLVRLALLLLQNLVAPGLEGGEAALDATRRAAVEP
jgi:hypothetical protein